MLTVYHPTNWLLKMPSEPLFHRTREGCAAAHGITVEEVTETLYSGPESAIAPEATPEPDPATEAAWEGNPGPLSPAWPQAFYQLDAKAPATAPAELPAPEAVPASEPVKSTAKKSKSKKA